MTVESHLSNMHLIVRWWTWSSVTTCKHLSAPRLHKGLLTFKVGRAALACINRYLIKPWNENCPNFVFIVCTRIHLSRRASPWGTNRNKIEYYMRNVIVEIARTIACLSATWTRPRNSPCRFHRIPHRRWAPHICFCSKETIITWSCRHLHELLNNLAKSDYICDSITLS